MPPPPSAAAEAFRSTLGDLGSDRLQQTKLGFDDARRRYGRAWERLRPPIEGDPSAAPAAAKQMIESVRDIGGVVLAMSRTDGDVLFDDFKTLLESMLRLGEGKAGYVAAHAVPPVPAGFLYMMASAASLHWRSWKVLRLLLQEKFEWYYHSGRPLFDYGFHQAYFFHSEALGRRGDVAHDVFREALFHPPYLDILGLDRNGALDAYLQAQLLHCLRAAQEAERGEGGGIWPDFGRFHDFRVIPLLDRAYNDQRFAGGLTSAFNESIADWKSKLNDRLRFIYENYWRASRYLWSSVSSYEPR